MSLFNFTFRNSHAWSNTQLCWQVGNDCAIILVASVSCIFIHISLRTLDFDRQSIRYPWEHRKMFSLCPVQAWKTWKPLSTLVESFSTGMELQMMLERDGWWRWIVLAQESLINQIVSVDGPFPLLIYRDFIVEFRNPGTFKAAIVNIFIYNTD